MRGLAYDKWRDYDWLRVTPVPVDAAIAAFCRGFASNSAAKRIGLRAALDVDEFYTLLAFAMRMAVLSMRERSEERVRDGLMAVAIADYARVDRRDVSRSLSVLSHAAHDLRLDAVALFEEAAQFADEGVAASLRALGLPHDLESGAGYHVVHTRYGVGLIRWGLQTYDPASALSELLLDVGDLVEADRYHVSAMELATDLPAVWLPDDPRIPGLLRRATAGATLHAGPAAEHNGQPSQTLLAFVLQCAGAADADDLRRMSALYWNVTFASLALSHDRLFCLLVASARREGVRPIETTPSLARFREPLAAILAKYAATGANLPAPPPV